MSDSIRDAVMASMEAKIYTAEQLEQALKREAEVSQMLKEAQQSSAIARKAALRSGWDERSLRRLGLIEQSRKPTQRKKSSTLQDKASDQVRADDDKFMNPGDGR